MIQAWLNWHAQALYFKVAVARFRDAQLARLRIEQKTKHADNTEFTGWKLP